MIEIFPNSKPHDLGHEWCYQNRDTARRWAMTQGITWNSEGSDGTVSWVKFSAKGNCGGTRKYG